MFSSFRPLSNAGPVTYSVPDPANNAYYLQHFGYARPGRR
jgi:hypothetical protein